MKKSVFRIYRALLPAGDGFVAAVLNSHAQLLAMTRRLKQVNKNPPHRDLLKDVKTYKVCSADSRAANLIG
jgi:hypothetical protein